MSNTKPQDLLPVRLFNERTVVSPRSGSDQLGIHRVCEPPGVLPQAAQRLDTRAEIYADEVRIRVERLNLDAASFRQLERAHHGDGAAVREAVLSIVAERGKMQNPVTGSGGMLVGTVEEVGADSPLGLAPGDRVATLVSLSLTPLVIEDGLQQWDGRSEQVPADGYAILFGRSIAARLPDDLPVELALAVLDVCGAPALTTRVVERYAGGADPVPPVALVIGGAGKSGSLALAAARRAGARTVGVVPHEEEARLLREADLADHVVVADARDAVGLRDAVAAVAPGPGPCHRGLRRRARLRGWRGPVHPRRRHSGVLLDGHLLHRRRTGGRGGGCRRDDADRQRLRPRARRPGPRPGPHGAGGAPPLRATDVSGMMGR